MVNVKKTGSHYRITTTSLNDGVSVAFLSKDDTLELFDKLRLELENEVLHRNRL